MASELGASAVWYAKHGWRVLPVRERLKKPMLLGWEKDATTNLATLEHWWSKWPLANVGIACGPETGLWVLDVDGARGQESLEDLQRIHGRLPETVCQVTGSGGQQFFFRFPEGVTIPNRVGFRKGLDVRSEGGQVLVPPSIHPNGRAYAWDLRPDEYPLAEAPAWLIAIVQDTRTTDQTADPLKASTAAGPTHPSIIRRAVAYLAKLPPSISGSNGHGAAYRAAAALVHGFALDAEEARRLFVEHFNPRCQPEWDGKEIDHKITQAFAKDHAEARGYLLARSPARTQEERPTRAAAPHDGEDVFSRREEAAQARAENEAAASNFPQDEDDEPKDGLPPAAATGPTGGTGTEGDDRPEFPLNDLGNALRFAYVHGERVRYCHTWDSWLIWTGTHWEKDLVTRVVLLMESAISETCDEMAKVEGEDEDEDDDKGGKKAASKDSPRIRRLERAVKDAANHLKELKNWKKKSLSHHSIRAALILAQAREELAVTIDQLDKNKFLFAVANGCVDPRTGELTEHDPNNLVTRYCPIEYIPGFRDDRWEGLLNHLSDNDREMLACLQRAAGVSMTSDTRDQKIFILSGPGGTGKSTFIDGLGRVLNSYVKKVPFDLFLTKNSDRKPWVLADCAKTRMVVSEESDEGSRMASSIIKELTGGTTISVEPKGKQPFEYKPGFKLWMVTNDLPHLSDMDSGMWRRLMVFRFDKLPTKRDVTLKTYIEENDNAAKAILAWMIEGAKAWHQAGEVGTCHHVEESLRQYRSDENPIRPFMDAALFLDENGQITNAELWTLYRQWALENGVKHLVSAKSMSKRLTALGLESMRVYSSEARSSVRGWSGLRVRQACDADDAGLMPSDGSKSGSVTTDDSEASDDASAAGSTSHEAEKDSVGQIIRPIGQIDSVSVTTLSGGNDNELRPVVTDVTDSSSRAYSNPSQKISISSERERDLSRRPTTPPPPWETPPNLGQPGDRGAKLRRGPGDHENHFDPQTPDTQD
jgi:P4 family phage/plasmid primase-like protien